MRARTLVLILSCLTVAAMAMTGCAPAAAPSPTPPPPKAEIPVAQATVAVATPQSATKPQADQPKSGGVLTVSTVGDPFTFDMHQEASYLVENVLQCAYSGVAQFDPDNPEETIGDLARNWDISKDGLAYTFHLQENVTFHDGSPFGAEDVQFSFERMIRPPKGIASPRRADLGAIDKVEALDKNTARFTLKYPSSAFLNVISSGFMVIYARAFVEKKGDMKRDVMGTGPYKFKRYTEGTSLEYVKNPAYFVKGRPYLDGITFYVIKDAGTRLAAFRTGQVKLTGPGVSGLTPADAEIIKKTMPQGILLPYVGLGWANFIMNNQREPWNDIRVRKAAHLAIDRQKAIEVLAQGYGELGSFMPGKWGIPQDELLKMPGWRQPKDADIAEAKRLLTEAGYPNGLTVKALVRAERSFEQVAVYLTDQMAKIGIKLELDVKDPAVRTMLMNQGNFNCHPTMHALNFPDPENLARYWVAPVGEDWGLNWTRNSDDKITELFDKQSRAIDPAERRKIVRELDLRMIDLAARSIMYWQNTIIGMWPEVKNRGKLIGDYNFQKYQDVWLAK